MLTNVFLALLAGVWVETTPPGGLIYVDGRAVGRAPLEVEVPVGTMVIGATLGELSGGYALQGRRPDRARIDILLIPPGETLFGRPWNPSWGWFAVGASM